ncbi:hypothetical protein [Novosphingobium panipatense]|uniref:hypothetical protein n=1 Tax=Novosphingobium panipatense TaxID=428991 RepID=UPI003614ED26
MGLTVALGRRSTAAANVAHSRDATRISSRFTYNSGYGEGSWNVNLASQEVVSGTGTDYRAADVRYRGHHATLGGGVDNFDGETRVNGFIQGSIVAMGGLFLAPTVDRSFAVVRGGGPNTPLLVDRGRSAIRTRTVARCCLRCVLWRPIASRLTRPAFPST